MEDLERRLQKVGISLFQSRGRERASSKDTMFAYTGSLEIELITVISPTPVRTCRDKEKA